MVHACLQSSAADAEGAERSNGGWHGEWWRRGGLPGPCKTLGLHYYQRSQLVFSKPWPLRQFSKAKRHPRMEAGACHLGDFAATGTRKTN